jgi:hypothetical protein
MLRCATQRMEIGSLERMLYAYIILVSIYIMLFSISQGRRSYWFLVDSKRIKKNDIAGDDALSS